MHKKIGNFVIDSFLVSKNYYFNDKDVKSHFQWFIWRKSWNEDLDILWFHIYNWYFCVKYKDYFMRFLEPLEW